MDVANAKVLECDRSPSRSVGKLDNRGSHFYLALYWAEALAAQDQELELRALFVPVAAQLAQAEARILAELNGAQGSAVDIGGYYHPDPALCAAVMRPSATLNAIIDAIG